MPDHKTEDYKQSAVDYYLVGDNTQEEVCQIFKCSVRSLMRWVDKFENDGEIKRHNRKPIAYKVKNEHVKLLLDEIKQNKTITLQELLQKLKEKYKDVYTKFFLPSLNTNEEYSDATKQRSFYFS